MSSTAVESIINPSSKSRIITILSFPVIALALGIPWWIHTTSIERRSLAAIGTVHGIREGWKEDKVVVRVEQGGESDVLRWTMMMNTCVPAQHRAWELEAAEKPREGSKVDRAIQPPRIKLVDDAANSALPSIDTVPSSPSFGTLLFPAPTTPLRRFGENVIPTRDECSAAGSIKLRDTLETLLPLQPWTPPGHAIKYAENVTLSFVMLNEDASADHGRQLVRGWDVEDALRTYIQPVLAALEPFHSVTIESQILYHAPLKFVPTSRTLNTSLTDGAVTKVWTVSDTQASGFVNTEQWTLDSGSTNNPVLRFLLFVPKASRRPLILQQSLKDDDRKLSLLSSLQRLCELMSRCAEAESISSTAISTFRIPQFGSVVIPAYPGRRDDDEHMSSLQMRQAFTIFRKDLLQLLGVPPLPETLCTGDADDQAGLELVITPWQFSSLLRTHVQATTVSAVDTSTSISRLVSRIREMRVGKEVVGDVESSVHSLTEAFGKRSTRADKGLMGVWERTKRASALADRAFFNPSMVGLLYFPDEHKYAVYAPLFAPISVPVIVAIIKEVKRWRKKRKARRAPGVVANNEKLVVVSKTED
ncbi:hypothetical protein QFC22_005906 [Naganishia vaughanmartiniae]|uniref:Uncharacterized protein n=1 Tax=Naganishia vaughanmartiniae TaxID=1424756 RepID=A0ACC2WTF0_9TREE|nr:hypothetical protein QFC22_005906 [Naganishia vaughanmartiniae]